MQEDQPNLPHLPLQALLDAQAIDLSVQQSNALILLVEELLKWNQQMNLTGIQQFDKALTHHIMDSLSVLSWIDSNAILDFGTGAGFPGLPLAIALPHCQVTLVESNSKKCRFIRHITRLLKLENVVVKNSRMEQIKGRSYDQIITRAVTDLSQIWSLCRPALTEKGKIIAMKSTVNSDEIAALKTQFELQVSVIQLTKLAGLDQRCLVMMNQCSEPT